MGRFLPSWLGGCLAIAIGMSQPALAADCPGNPDALGTSRTLVVDPMEHPRIGTMQYPETLPLRDREVVLTFDDGPLPPHSNQVLQILASECVKATFFIIGRMARQFPEGVRRVRDAGHSIGTHSENHPLNFNKMSPERIKQEIDDGIAHTAAALGDGSSLAPFFRVPGLRRGEVMEDYLVSKGLQSWSADFPADDWRHISADQVYNYAISRIEAKGRGILLLHDIQARTVAALPRILRTLKARGYRIVHVVPASPSRPKTPTQPWQWRMHPAAETVAISHWPRVPRFLFVTNGTLPAPALNDWDRLDSKLLEAPASPRMARGHTAPLIETAWPQPLTIQATAQTATLPVPEQAIFALPERKIASNYGVSLMPRRPRPQQVKSSVGSTTRESVAPPLRIIPGSVPIAQPGLQPTSAAVR